FERGPVGAPAERAVQVDEVDPVGAGLLPGQRGLHRVAVAGLGAGLALEKPDGLTVGHVDRGQQGERHQIPLSQLDSRVAPASPDFSGWNWVEDSRPSSTAAANGSPWVAQVTRAAESRNWAARA